MSPHPPSSWTRRSDPSPPALTSNPLGGRPPARPSRTALRLAPLNTVFEVVEDDARAADFVGLAVLHAVAREAAPAAITACLPCPPAGRCPEAEAAVPLEAGTPASRCASPDNWYAMRLVWLLPRGLASRAYFSLMVHEVTLILELHSLNNSHVKSMVIP